MKRTDIVLKGIAVALIFAASASMLSSCARSRDSRDRTDRDPAGQREAKIVINPVKTDKVIERYFPDIKEFDDFDIDYNQFKYLIETRCSGALIKPYSAIVISFKTGDQTVKNPVITFSGNGMSEFAIKGTNE
ncbi:MAG: hypothetical protein IIY21_16410 [Clostridiales bacterium]|nr:hypothetical protein [Clostridiales bacterium]